MSQAQTIVAREKLDFGLDGDIPQYWFGGDVFKSRFFDAMSTIFPEGERFFIECVRDFRDQVTDPQLKADIKGFIRQEGQHGIVHDQYNQRLKAQGIDVDKVEAGVRGVVTRLRKFLPKSQTLAHTAAAEHLTAIMAHSFFERKEVLAASDPRMRAMFAWHAMEEIEHKAVAFDVMQQVAKVGYLRRCMALIGVTIGFNLHALFVTGYMLQCDGYSFLQRARLFAGGLWWLFKPGGLYLSTFKHYIAYFKPGFHPWQTGQMRSYGLWLETLNRTGNPILAGEALHAAGA
jgi:uncharacterized protein